MSKQQGDELWLLSTWRTMKSRECHSSGENSGLVCDWISWKVTEGRSPTCRTDAIFLFGIPDTKRSEEKNLYCFPVCFQLLLVAIPCCCCCCCSHSSLTSESSLPSHVDWTLEPSWAFSMRLETTAASSFMTRAATRFSGSFMCHGCTTETHPSIVSHSSKLLLQHA